MEAVSFNCKDSCVVKNPVQCTEQGIILVKVCPPGRRSFVAGKHKIVATFFVVPPVNQVKEQSGIFYIKLTMAYFVNDQTRGSNQTVQDRIGLSCAILVGPEHHGMRIPVLNYIQQLLPVLPEYLEHN